MIFVTGGAGFIGSNFILDWLDNEGESVVNLDKLTYAGNIENLSSLENDSRHIFVKGDVGDSRLVDRLLAKYRPRAVLNFAAESHVDRSIRRTSFKQILLGRFVYWKLPVIIGLICTVQKEKTFVSYMLAQMRSMAASVLMIHHSRK